MTTYPLFESGNATVEANGLAQATLQPLRAFEVWEVRRMTVQSSSTVLVPTAKIFRGAVSDSRLVDGTHTGTLDHTDTDLHLQSGEALIAVWEGADVGASCTFTIEGKSVR